MASTVGHLWANVTFARQPFDGLPAGSGCCTTLYPDFHSFTFAHSNQAPGTHADHQPVGRTAAALQPDPARTWPASILAELHGVPWRQRPGADRRIPPPVWLGCQLLGTRLPWRQGRGQRLPGAAYSAGHYFLERRPAAFPQRTGAIRIFKKHPPAPEPGLHARQRLLGDHGVRVGPKRKIAKRRGVGVGEVNSFSSWQVGTFQRANV